MSVPLRPALELDRAGFKVYVDGVWVPLSLNRYRALCAFLDRPGEVLTHRAIFEAAAGYRYPSRDMDQLAGDARTIVYRLRRALGDSVEFVPVRGIGYRMEVQR